MKTALVRAKRAKVRKRRKRYEAMPRMRVTVVERDERAVAGGRRTGEDSRPDLSTSS